MQIGWFKLNLSISGSKKLKKSLIDFLILICPLKQVKKWHKAADLRLSCEESYCQKICFIRFLLREEGCDSGREFNEMLGKASDPKILRKIERGSVSERCEICISVRTKKWDCGGRKDASFIYSKISVITLNKLKSCSWDGGVTCQGNHRCPQHASVSMQLFMFLFMQLFHQGIAMIW